jgi:hypothetical protein
MSPCCRTVVGTGAFLYRRASGLPAAPAAGNAYGHVAEWLRSGLQNRLPRFNSGRGLQLSLPSSFGLATLPRKAAAPSRGGEAWRSGGASRDGQACPFGAFKAGAALL